jgi:hypothetical protein
MLMMTTNVYNKASGASAGHFYIASRSGLSVSLASCHNPFQSLAKWALD